MLLSSEQRIGALILLGIALVAWIAVAVWPSRQPMPDEPKRYRTWEERKDSMKRADSIRYAQWAAEREQRYDSFRIADSIRRAEWKTLRQQQFDSFRLADSLWRDSVGWRFAKRLKKDTVLDLNHCDTAELQFIRGIGRYTAVLIVRYREQLGGFCCRSQLSDEPLAQCRLDTLVQHFSVDPADVQPIPVNTSSVSALQRHPYIRFEQAKAIYSLRRKQLRLSSIQDLSTLPELTEQDLIRLAPYLSFE